MRNTYYILGYIVGFCVSLGYLFKLMHWPYANVLSITGVALFVLAFMPVDYTESIKTDQGSRNKNRSHTAPVFV
jgi:hypothetical protein